MDQNFESMSVNGMSGVNSGSGYSYSMPGSGSTFGTESTSGTGSTSGTPSMSVPNQESTVTGTGMSGMSGTAGMNNAGGSMNQKSTINDQVIATDLLISAKTGVKTYADAITEAATPSVRTMLKRQLDEAIAFQDQVSAYMTKKGWYNAYNVNQQILMDLNQTQQTMNQIG